MTLLSNQNPENHVRTAQPNLINVAVLAIVLLMGFIKVPCFLVNAALTITHSTVSSGNLIKPTKVVHVSLKNTAP